MVAAAASSAAGSSGAVGPFTAPSPGIPAQQRWLEKRVGDLTTQGMAPDTAHAQALAEYNTKYSYTRPAESK